MSIVSLTNPLSPQLFKLEDPLEWELEATLEMLGKTPRFCDLKDAIGSTIGFSISSCDFLAECTDRKIILDPSLFRNKLNNICPQLIESILFEMNNLKLKGLFDDLINNAKSLTPDEFVEKFERLEHLSALETKRALREIFPSEDWHCFPFAYVTENFDLHYLMQQTGEHSLGIWMRFPYLFNRSDTYIGTWKPVPLDEKKFVIDLLNCQIDMDDPDQFVSETSKKNFCLIKQYIFEELKNKDLLFRLTERINVIETFGHRL